MSPRRLSRAALLRMRERLLQEQAVLEQRLAAIRLAIAGLEGLLAEPEAERRALSLPKRQSSPGQYRGGGKPLVIPHEDWPRIAARIAEGEMLEGLAKQYGVSRERIRQVVAKVDPSASEQGQCMRRSLRREQRLVEAEVRMVQRALRNGPCLACLGPVTRGTRGTKVGYGRSTCSPRCAELWARCRMHLDEEEWKKHRISNARSVLKSSSPSARNRYRRDTAERILAGEARTHGRWVLPEHGRVAEGLQEVQELRAVVGQSGESWWL